MAALLYTNKIDSAGPTRQNQFRTERFQVDSYTIRAAQGLNPAVVKYNVIWTCLTQAEADALADSFDATNGVDLIQWTPPLENVELNFTVESYDVALETTVGSNYQFQISATLNKEYDIV